MNTGVISKRYATALLKLVDETGHGEEVYTQVKALLADPDNPPMPLCEDLQRFVTLLSQNGRISYVRLIFSSFVAQYNDSRNIHVAHLTTVQPSPALEERLKTLICERTGGTVVMDTKVDPELIGGFVLDLDGMTIDASVAHQLDDIRRQFLDKNKRIV